MTLTSANFIFSTTTKRYTFFNGNDNQFNIGTFYNINIYCTFYGSSIAVKSPTFEIRKLSCFSGNGYIGFYYNVMTITVPKNSDTGDTASTSMVKIRWDYRDIMEYGYNVSDFVITSLTSNNNYFIPSQPSASTNPLTFIFKFSTASLINDDARIEYDSLYSFNLWARYITFRVVTPINPVNCNNLIFLRN